MQQKLLRLLLAGIAAVLSLGLLDCGSRRGEPTEPPLVPHPGYTDVSEERGLQLPGWDVSVGMYHVSAVDVNDDGFVDVFFALGDGAQPLAVLLNDGTGSFSPAQTSPIPPCTSNPLGWFMCSLLGSVWADFNGDGQVDLLVVGGREADSIDRSRALFLSRGGASKEFELATQTAGLACTDPPEQCQKQYEGACVADVDGDGDLDIFMVSGLKGPGRGFETKNLLYINDGNGRFELKVHAANTKSRACAFADFDDDGDVDLFLLNDFDLSIPGIQSDQIFVNDGSGLFQEKTELVTYGCHRAATNARAVRDVRVADFNADGNLDILTCCGASGTTQIAFGDGKGKTTGSTNLGFSSEGHEDDRVSIGDFDADGDIDVLLANRRQATRLFQNDGSASFTEVGESMKLNVGYSGNHEKDVVFTDFDNDGTLEVIRVQGTDRANHVNLFIAPPFAPGSRFLRVRPVTKSDSLFLGADVRVFEAGTKTEAAVRAVIDSTSGSRSSYDAFFGLTKSTASVFDVEIRCGDANWVTKEIDPSLGNVAPNQVIVAKCDFDDEVMDELMFYHDLAH